MCFPPSFRPCLHHNVARKNTKAFSLCFQKMWLYTTTAWKWSPFTWKHWNKWKRSSMHARHVVDDVHLWTHPTYSYTTYSSTERRWNNYIYVKIYMYYLFNFFASYILNLALHWDSPLLKHNHLLHWICTITLEESHVMIKLSLDYQRDYNHCVKHKSRSASGVTTSMTY